MNASSNPLTLADQQWRSVIAAATAAPSTHNTQPWRFVVEPDGVHVHLDPDRSLPVVDPTGRESRLSCGAALFNLRMALRALDLEPLVTLFPQRQHPTLLATVRLRTVKQATPQELALHAAIPVRHSHRRPFHPAPLPSAVLQQVVYAAGVEGGYLRLVQDPPVVRALTSLIRRADHQQSLNAAHVAELAAWVTGDQSRPDGVPLAATAPRAAPGSVLAMRDFTGGRAGQEREYESDPLLAVLLSAGDTPRDEVQAGQALQRALLTATIHGAATSILSAPTEVPAIRAALRDLVGGAMYPQLVLRLGSSAGVTASPRRPVDDLVDPPR
jgi:hypothetical protein